jgi:hypothetical protein
MWFCILKRAPCLSTAQVLLVLRVVQLAIVTLLDPVLVLSVLFGLFSIVTSVLSNHRLLTSRTALTAGSARRVTRATVERPSEASAPDTPTTASTFDGNKAVWLDASGVAISFWPDKSHVAEVWAAGADERLDGEKNA